MYGGPFTVIQSGVQDKNAAGTAIFNDYNMVILHRGSNQVTYQTNTHSDDAFQVHYLAAERSFQVIQIDFYEGCDMKISKIVSASDAP